MPIVHSPQSTVLSPQSKGQSRGRRNLDWRDEAGGAMGEIRRVPLFVRLNPIPNWLIPFFISLRPPFAGCFYNMGVKGLVGTGRVKGVIKSG